MSSPMFPRCLNFFFVSLTPITSGHGTLSEEGKLGQTQNQQYVFRVNIVDSQGDSSPKLLKHTATVVFLRPAWSPQLETDSIRPCAVPAHRYSWLAIHLSAPILHLSPVSDRPGKWASTSAPSVNVTLCCYHDCRCFRRQGCDTPLLGSWYWW